MSSHKSSCVHHDWCNALGGNVPLRMPHCPRLPFWKEPDILLTVAFLFTLFVPPPPHPISHLSQLLISAWDESSCSSSHWHTSLPDKQPHLFQSVHNRRTVIRESCLPPVISSHCPHISHHYNWLQCFWCNHCSSGQLRALSVLVIHWPQRIWHATHTFSSLTDLTLQDRKSNYSGNSEFHCTSIVIEYISSVNKVWI